MAVYKLYDGSLIGMSAVLNADTAQAKGLQLGTILKGFDYGPGAYGEAEFRYVKFSGTVSEGDWVVINNAAFTAARTAAASRGQIGICMTAQVTTQFGWVMIRGIHEHANVVTGVAADTALYLSATAGQLSGTVVANQRVDTAYERLITSITGLTAWVASTAYQEGHVRTNGGNTYVCQKQGTSASSGGPTGTTTSIADGSCNWRYIGTGGGTVEINWPSASGSG